jgi:hypothetical protein
MEDRTPVDKHALVVEATKAATTGIALAVPNKGLEAGGQLRELLAGVSVAELAPWSMSLVTTLISLVIRIIGHDWAHLRRGRDMGKSTAAQLPGAWGGRRAGSGRGHRACN